MKLMTRLALISLLMVSGPAMAQTDSTGVPDGDVGYTAPADPTTGFVMTENKWCRGGVGSTTIVCDKDEPTGSDNLGNHTATQAINASNHGVNNAGPIAGATNVTASGTVAAATVTASGNISAAGNVNATNSIVAGNAVYAPNYFRSTGGTGWINETYGGGFYMSDTSWVRVYGNKGLYTAGQIYSSTSMRADGNITIGGTAYATAYLHNSDRSLKSDITTIVDPFLILNGIHGSRYVWKETGVPAYGVIAQDVEAVMPEAVQVTEAGTKAVEYDQLIAPMIEAIKQLKADNDNLRAELEELKLAVGN